VTSAVVNQFYTEVWLKEQPSAKVNQFYTDVWLKDLPSAKVNQFYTDVWSATRPGTAWGNADGVASVRGVSPDPPEQFIFPVYTPRRVNWRDPLTAGLSYFRTMDSLNQQPMHSRAPQKLVPTDSSLIIIPGLGGNGLSCTSTTGRMRDTANTFGMQGNEFTAMSYGVAYWSPTDGLSHAALAIGCNAGDTTPEFTLVKFTDNQWYIGFYVPSTDYRFHTAASGTFTIGVPFVVGYRFKVSGEHAFWCAGKKLNTATTTLGSQPSLAHDEFCVGGTASTSGIGGAHSWAKNDKSQVYWVAVWDRALRDDEFQRISADPWCLLHRFRYVRPRTPVGAGHADGIADVIGTTVSSAVGHADGTATAVSNSSQAIGNADGIAQVEGISNVGSDGNADGVAQVAGVSSTPNTSGAGHANGQANVFANHPAAIRAGAPMLLA
jgi:hypothetical protein